MWLSGIILRTASLNSSILIPFPANRRDVVEPFLPSLLLLSFLWYLKSTESSEEKGGNAILFIFIVDSFSVTEMLQMILSILIALLALYSLLSLSALIAFLLVSCQQVEKRECGLKSWMVISPAMLFAGGEMRRDISAFLKMSELRLFISMEKSFCSGSK